MIHLLWIWHFLLFVFVCIKIIIPHELTFNWMGDVNSLRSTTLIYKLPSSPNLCSELRFCSCQIQCRRREIFQARVYWPVEQYWRWLRSYSRSRLHQRPSTVRCWPWKENWRTSRKKFFSTQRWSDICAWTPTTDSVWPLMESRTRRRAESSPILLIWPINSSLENLPSSTLNLTRAKS